MPTHIRIAEPKTFSSRQKAPSSHQKILGVPLIIWTLALLVIVLAARYDAPIGSFDLQDLLAPF